MKVKEIVKRLNVDYPIKFSIHYKDSDDGGYDEIVVDTEFNKAVLDLVGERELGEKDSIWFAHDTLNLWLE